MTVPLAKDSRVGPLTMRELMKLIQRVFLKT